jgi:hypothetical protein
MPLFPRNRPVCQQLKLVGITSASAPDQPNCDGHHCGIACAPRLAQGWHRPEGSRQQGSGTRPTAPANASTFIASRARALLKNCSACSILAGSRPRLKAASPRNVRSRESRSVDFDSSACWASASPHFRLKRLESVRGRRRRDPSVADLGEFSRSVGRARNFTLPSK